MKTIVVIAIVAALASAAFAADIASLAWNQSNIETLRSSDKAAILEFINGAAPDFSFTESSIWEFGWYDLAGDGKYELAFTGSMGTCCVYVAIFSKDSAGKVSEQTYNGAGKLSTTIRDLNGEGKKELVLWQEIAKQDDWFPRADTPEWPAVYRLEKGKYAEASHEFPNFYDREVLPNLDREIQKGEQEMTRIPELQDNVARLVLQRDKILRVLGRDPAAGLKQAYQWMNSDDIQLLQSAIATFQDIGGHEQELQEAQQKMPAAMKREMDALRGG